MTSHLCAVMPESPVDKASPGPWTGADDYCRKRATHAVFWTLGNTTTYVCPRHLKGYDNLGDSLITPLDYEIEEEEELL